MCGPCAPDRSAATDTTGRDLVDAVAPRGAVLLAAPHGRLAGYALDARCLREALLEPFGQPVPVPCGRCDRCLPAS